MVSVRSPDNCMFSWSQAENSELKFILVLAWSSYSPPPQEWIVSLQDERRRAGAGVGESSQMGRIIFFLHPVPPCSSWAQSPDLAVEGTTSASELLWFQETQNSLCSDEVCLPLLFSLPSLSLGKGEEGWPHRRLKVMRMGLTWTYSHQESHAG